MPHDKPEAEAVQTNRRTFLARAALGGALVTVATAGPLGQLLPAAAQEGEGAGEPGGGGSSDQLQDRDVAAQLTPLELAAVQVYESAASNTALDLEWTALVRRFQTHHRAAADRLGEMVHADDAEPTADPTILEGTGAAVESAGDQDSILSALAELEELLAATHLWALGSISEPVTARLVLQVQATESQQAVVLARATGTSITELTPAIAPVGDAPAAPTAPSTDSGTAADADTDTAETDGSEAGADEETEN